MENVNCRFYGKNIVPSINIDLKAYKTIEGKINLLNLSYLIFFISADNYFRA